MPLAGRFSNLKPISEFFDYKRMSKPNSFSEIQSRASYNLGYFSSNYAVIVLMLSIYSLLTNLLLLFVILLVVGGVWGIKRLDGRDLAVGRFTFFLSFPVETPLGDLPPCSAVLIICTGHLSQSYLKANRIDYRTC